MTQNPICMLLDFSPMDKETDFTFINWPLRGCCIHGAHRYMCICLVSNKTYLLLNYKHYVSLGNLHMTREWINSWIGTNNKPVVLQKKKKGIHWSLKVWTIDH